MSKLSQRISFLVISCLITVIAINNVPTTSPVIEETVLETIEKVEVIDESLEVEPVSVEEVEIEIDEFVETQTYSEDDLWLLAHIIWGEAGSNWISDSTQQCVASVVMNRVNSNAWPDTVYDVVHQSGQYTCISWCFSAEPTQRCYDNALYVLTNGSQLPSNVVYQSSVAIGQVYCVQDGVVFSCG